MRNSTKRLAVSGLIAGTVIALISILGLRAADAEASAPVIIPGAGINRPPAAMSQTPKPAAALAAAPAAVANPRRVAELDAPRQFALGMIETGNDDSEIGGAGEVSRYQIMPAVWEHYSESHRYRNPAAALAVAKSHWASLYAAFKRRAHREPSDFDMYVLWNTRHGYYAKCGFNPARLSPVVRDRAQRFVNLVERAES